jgi:outer membrane murein-binding lipoprotein Lpp
MKMKKSILTLASFAVISAVTLPGCYSSAEKMEHAKTNVIAANKTLDKATEEYLSDIEAYRKIAAEKVKANDESISQFKKRIESEKKDVKSDYDQRLETLEQKNSDFKKKLEDYKAKGKAEWEFYKTELNHDMEELAEAIKNLSVKTTK